MKCYCYIVEICDELGENGKILEKIFVYIVHYLTNNVYDIIKKHFSCQKEPLESYILCDEKEEGLGGLKTLVNLKIKSIQKSE